MLLTASPASILVVSSMMFMFSLIIFWGYLSSAAIDTLNESKSKNCILVKWSQHFENMYLKISIHIGNGCTWWRCWFKFIFPLFKIFDEGGNKIETSNYIPLAFEMYSSELMPIISGTLFIWPFLTISYMDSVMKAPSCSGSTTGAHTYHKVNNSTILRLKVKSILKEQYG